MLDYVIRNARVPGAANGGAVDIGFSKGKIAAIEPKLVADSPSYDAQGCLCCGGLVETHIHLDKSRIIDRCTPEPSRDNPNHMRRVQAVKSGFTVEDIYNRAKVTLENCIKQGTTRIRTHAEIDLPVGTKVHRGAEDAAEGICLGGRSGNLRLRAGGPGQRAGGRRGAGAGAQDGRDLDRRRAELRHRPSRPHQPRVRAGAANTTSTSTCTSIPATTRRRWTTCSWPT